MLRPRRGEPSPNQQRLWPICRQRPHRAAARTAFLPRTTTCVVSATPPGVPAVCAGVLAFHAAASSARMRVGNASRPAC
eukprot:14093141-Alexandrium_andersonii.AAC.1